jgi:hypothetical protein
MIGKIIAVIVIVFLGIEAIEYNASNGRSVAKSVIYSLAILAGVLGAVLL